MWAGNNSSKSVDIVRGIIIEPLCEQNVPFADSAHRLIEIRVTKVGRSRTGNRFMKPVRKSVAYGPIDVHVGKRVRIRRKLLDMSQTDLGDAVGLTF